MDNSELVGRLHRYVSALDKRPQPLGLRVGTRMTVQAMSEAADRITTLEARLAAVEGALKIIASGTPDATPPFRAMPASEMSRIASQALGASL